MSKSIDPTVQAVLDELLKDYLAAHPDTPPSKLAELRRYLADPTEYDQYNKCVVGVREFLLSPDYMNARNPDGSPVLYPKVIDHLEELNSGDYDEAVLTGAIGSAKTTVSLYTIAYQLYLLSCLRNPHQLFNLDPASEILVIFQSLNANTAKTVDYDRFKAMIDRSDYFRQHFPYNRKIVSQLEFPNRIIVKPVSGADTATIGQNVIGGLIDEVNFMQIIEKSAKTQGGTYDQAKALYEGLDRRRKSRFMLQGKLPGVLCLSSSKRYPGEFTDTKIEEAERELAETGRTSIYVYDKRAWDVKPEGTFSGEWFQVFVGDMTRRPRVLKPDETVDDKDRHLITHVPVEYRSAFNGDIMGALRDIAGVSTLARFPFMMDMERVVACYGKHPSVFSRESVDFVETQLHLLAKNFVQPDLPRAAHIDLGVTGDSAGVAIGCVTGFQSMKALGFGHSEQEMMPMIRMDGTLEVKPPRGGEILFWKIRAVLLKLRQMGLNIRWVTFDTFQSTDSVQLLRQEGFSVGIQSMDKDNLAYENLKSAYYQGRIAQPSHEKCQKECLSLEKFAKTGKIDHPPQGSKDVSDAVAGVVHTLTNRREIWGMFGIPVLRMPSSVASPLDKAPQKPEVSPWDDPNLWNKVA